MRTTQHSVTRLKAKSGLLLSASFPLSTLALVATAQAQTVTVNAPTTANAVEAEIVAAQADSRDITINVTEAGVVTTPDGEISLIPTADQGDGNIVFTNDGSIGAVNAITGLPTDIVGVTLVGAGSDTPDNTLTATNNGLITGGFNATEFGGAASLTNSETGTIHGGVTLSSFDNATLVSPGAILGSVSVTARSSTDTDASSGATTTETTGGDAIATFGDVSSPDGDTTGNVEVRAEAGNASATFTGVAGDAIVRAYAPETSVETEAPAAPGTTVVTESGSITYAPVSATVTVTETGALSSLEVSAEGDVDVSVAGTVGDNVWADANRYPEVRNTTTTTTQTQDAAGEVIATSTSSTEADLLADSTLTITNTGVVGGEVDVNATRDATLLVAGQANDYAYVSASSTRTTTATTANFDPASSLASSLVLTETSTSTGGTASLEVTATGSIADEVDLEGDAGVTAIVAGSIGSLTPEGGEGDLEASSSGLAVSTTTTFGGDIEGVGPTGSTTVITRSATGGPITIEVAAGGLIGDDILADTNNGPISITNAGIIGEDVEAFASDTLITSDITSSVATGPLTTTGAGGATITTDSYVETDSQTEQTVGGAVSFTNTADGVVGFAGSGGVILNGLGDVTVVNQGDIRGTTTATSSGFLAVSTDTTETTSVTTVPVGPGLETLELTETLVGSTTISRTGGSVTGTYAGSHGTADLEAATDGSITQNADQSSTIDISGTVIGSVTSNAGQASEDDPDSEYLASGVANTTSTGSRSEVSLLDSDGNGTRAENFSVIIDFAAVSGADSEVTITGMVGAGDLDISADVTSNGATSSTVIVDGGAVAGSVTSNGTGAVTANSERARALTQTITGDTAVADTLTETMAGSWALADGAASASVLGDGSIGGDLSVNGIESAAATVATDASVGGDVSVAAGGSDFSQSTELSYSRDPETGVATVTGEMTSVTQASLASGDASATIAGTVGGSTDVEAARGDATVTLTGVSTGGVSASTGSFVTSTTMTQTGTGASDWDGTEFEELPIELADLVTMTGTTTSTAVGGAASVLVDSAQALRDEAVAATLGNVNANGLGGATVTVTGGSIVGRSANATSLWVNSVQGSSMSTSGEGTDSSSSITRTIVGGPALVSNAGTVAGGASAVSPTSATVNNTGRLGTLTGEAGVTADAIISVTSESTVVTDLNNPALEQSTTTITPVIALGDAAVNNAAGGIIYGDVGVSGATGTVINDGTIGGTITVGESVATSSTTTVTTGASPVETVTPAAANLVQAYTVNQNGFSRGITVTGALDPTDPTGTATTSTINATINLNDGSATLGNITAELDSAGNRVTNTVLNLNGSGFLGADEVLEPSEVVGPDDSVPSPVLRLTSDAQALGFGETQVRVTGVNTINKDGAGTFVINGASFVPSESDLPDVYTLDVGALNVNAGELQLTTSSELDLPTEFGIRGDINNSASLVIGRRITPGGELVGDSLAGRGNFVEGITVRQVGDYLQTAEGTTVVGLTPSLVRASDGSFTTLENAGIAADNSRVNITGDLDLAGEVGVNVNRDSLFQTGDGYTLFTYTGEGTVTATAAGITGSRFVTFDLIHDEASKEVRLEAARESYTSGAVNPNAAATAAALDSALASAIDAIGDPDAGTPAQQLAFFQDIAGVGAALDFRLSAAEAAQVFEELSSGEFYGSLASVDQNVVFGQTLDVLTNRRSTGGDLNTQVWFNPVGNWARFGNGGEFGASRIKTESYGGAFGVDFAYAPDGAIGLGGAYAEHKIDARGTPESADGRTWTVGVYATQGFGPFYVNGKFAYGWSKFDAERAMPLLARTAFSEFDAKQLDASAEVGYDFITGATTVTPFAKVLVRDVSFDDFTEEGAGAFSLDVEGIDDTIVSPVVGLRAGTVMQLGESLSVRPFAEASYTFQGAMPNDVTVRFVGDPDPANSFVLNGVDPDDFGTVELGFEAGLANGLNFFLAGSHSFGGGNRVTRVGGGLNFGFGGREAAVLPPPPPPAPVYAPEPVYTPAPPPPAPAPIVTGERG